MSKSTTKEPMMPPTDRNLEEQLQEQIQQLSTEHRRLVLEFAKGLTKPRPSGVPGKNLLPFAGSLSTNEAEDMARAIKDGCERIDNDAW